MPVLDRSVVSRLENGALPSKLPDCRATQAEEWPQVGLHITLGGGFNTSQISQKPLGNHENPLFFMDFQ